MSENTSALKRLELDDLDRKIIESFPGVIARKDLLRMMRSAFTVPVFVIEFLLGRYCSDTGEEVIREGLEYVRQTLAGKYVKPDQRELVKARSEQLRRYDLIEKVGAQLVGVGFKDKNGIQILKGYMEDGQFSRGREIISAEGSVVFIGNLDGDVETITRTSHLFYPMPKEMDMAFFDRIHCYLPGWEFDKTRDDYYSDHFGLVCDYLAEVLTRLRRDTFTHRAEEVVQFGSHLAGRDQKEVLNKVQPVFYTDPINAAVRAMGLE